MKIDDTLTDRKLGGGTNTRLNKVGFVALLFLLLPFEYGMAKTTSDNFNIRPFIGAKAGYQFSDDDTYHYSDPKGNLYGVFGGFEFTDSLSWDLGYQYHDTLSADVTNVDVQTSLAESAFRYNWRFNQDFSLFARLGIAKWWMEKQEASDNQIKSNGYSPIGQLGISYHASPNFRYSLGYQYIDEIGSSSTGSYDSHSVSFSVSYVFGDRKYGEVVNVENVIPVIEKPLIIPEIPESQVFAKATFGSDYSFAFDSTQVSLALSKQLLDVSSILSQYPQAIAIISGHTDSTGPFEYNMDLSWNRAKAVADKLVEYGVDESRLKVIAEGEFKPIATNLTSEGREKNRRVELVIPTFKF